MEKTRRWGWIPSSTLAKSVAGVAYNIASYGSYLRCVYLGCVLATKLTGLLFFDFISDFGANPSMGFVV